MPANSAAVGTIPISSWRSLNARALYMGVIGSPLKILIALANAVMPKHMTISDRALVKKELFLVWSIIAIL